MNNITKDFNGLPIVFREDGYINMTKAAKHFDKFLPHFLRSPDTEEYIAALINTADFADFIGKVTCKVHIEHLRAIIEVQMGRNGGTYCHPKLAVFFARWLDVRFAVWCDLMIDNILQGNIQTTVVVPTAEAVAVQAEAERMKSRILELEGEVQRLQEHGLKSGEIPRGWLTAWTHLEDQGHGYPFIKAAVKDFGMLCASACKRLVDEQGDGYSPITRKGRQGSKESDYTYYHPMILKDAYQKLLKMYEMAI